jgi:N-acyl-D-amino-acid deacylase
MWADIVVFDKDMITDVGSPLDPYHHPKGIVYVLVNGQIVVEKGEHAGILPGKILNKAELRKRYISRTSIDF